MPEELGSRHAPLIGVHISQACISRRHVFLIGVHLSWACISHGHASLKGMRQRHACLLGRISYSHAAQYHVYLSARYARYARCAMSAVICAQSSRSQETNHSLKKIFPQIKIPLHKVLNNPSPRDRFLMPPRSRHKICMLHQGFGCLELVKHCADGS